LTRYSTNSALATKRLFTKGPAGMPMWQALDFFAIS
jgi:hypothetical protein